MWKANCPARRINTAHPGRAVSLSMLFGVESPTGVARATKKAGPNSTPFWLIRCCLVSFRRRGQRTRLGFVQLKPELPLQVGLRRESRLPVGHDRIGLDADVLPIRILLAPLTLVRSKSLDSIPSDRFGTARLRLRQRSDVRTVKLKLATQFSPSGGRRSQRPPDVAVDAGRSCFPPISLPLPSTRKASPTDRVLRSASLLRATSGHFWPAYDLD
jgi:hypothetical protein